MSLGPPCPRECTTDFGSGSQGINQLLPQWKQFGASSFVSIVGFRRLRLARSRELARGVQKQFRFD